MVPDLGNHSGTHSGLLSGVVSGVGDDEKKRLIKYYKADLIYEYAKRINSNIGDILKKKIDEYLNDKSLDGCNNIITYNNGDLSLPVNISPQEETVWLTVNQIATLYETTTNNVYMHIQNIIDEGELEIATGKKSLLVGQLHKFIPISQNEGGREVMRNVDNYSLDVVLAAGYRVKSKRAVEFRRWVSSIMKQYLIQGYAVDQKNLVHILKVFLTSLMLNNSQDTVRKTINKIATANKGDEILIPDLGNHSGAHSGLLSGVVSGVGIKEKLTKYYSLEIVCEYARKIG